ncbi:hypothetical protein [Nocardia abscessus]|nr:hypothetical protein [Nocardia abscessus]
MSRSLMKVVAPAALGCGPVSAGARAGGGVSQFPPPPLWGG